MYLKLYITATHARPAAFNRPDKDSPSPFWSLSQKEGCRHGEPRSSSRFLHLTTSSSTSTENLSGRAPARTPGRLLRRSCGSSVGTSEGRTRTAIADVLTAYVSHIRTIKTAKSAQTDTYYLRDAFGPVGAIDKSQSPLSALDERHCSAARFKSPSVPWAGSRREAR